MANMTDTEIKIKEDFNNCELDTVKSVLTKIGARIVDIADDNGFINDESTVCFVIKPMTPADTAKKMYHLFKLYADDVRIMTWQNTNEIVITMWWD